MDDSRGAQTGRPFPQLEMSIPVPENPRPDRGLTLSRASYSVEDDARDRPARDPQLDDGVFHARAIGDVLSDYKGYGVRQTGDPQKVEVMGNGWGLDQY
jgi:hypothetical protein